MQRYIARLALALPLAAAGHAAAQPAETPAPADPAAPAPPEAPVPSPETAAPPPAAPETAAPPPPAAPDAVNEPVKPSVNAGTTAVEAIDEGEQRKGAESPASEGAIPATSLAGFDVTISGYVRAQYTRIDDDPNLDFVGRNDGFSISNARLIVDAKREDVSARISLEGAIDRRDRLNTSAGDVETTLADAWVGYGPFKWLKLRAGRFKPAFDAEELQSTGNLLFIDRAVESRGVEGVEGNNVEGLSLDRQVGVQLSSDPLMLGGSPFGIGYFLSATNGVDADDPVNDNDAVQFTGRLELYWDKIVTLGGAVFLNEQSPFENAEQQSGRSRFDIDQTGIAADLSFDAFGAILFAQYMRVASEFADVPGQPERVQQGYHVQVGYRAPFGLIPAYRYAFYDPFDFDAVSVDLFELQYHTLGLTWLVPDKPLKLQVNYTITVEKEGPELENDRLDALVQASF